MKKFRTVAAVVIMFFAAMAGYFVGAALQEEMGGVYRRFGSRGSFIDGIDCSLQCIRPYHF